MPYSYRSSGPRNQRRTYSSKRSYGRNNTKSNINPTRFVKPAAQTQADAYVQRHVFADFKIHELLQRNIRSKGFNAPLPIQDQAIPEGLAGKDVVGIANTGTGKTIAFALPMLHKLLSDRSARAIILAPTRELAEQIEEEFRSVARGSGLRGALLIGGSSMGVQLRDLRQRPSIVIGTPGRVKDHLERRTLDISGFNLLALDEVDRMLDMGFVNDIRWILSRMPASRQSFFFTATLDNAISNLIREFSNDPVTISVKTSETTDMVIQDVVNYTSSSDRLDRLHDLLISAPKSLVFDNTQRSVERLSKELQTRGFSADAIHGGKAQGQRRRALARFRSSDINVLVATDVAARGLDVTDITHVINFSAPKSYDDYIHRIGRAGRAGRNGFAYTFVEA